jgi:DNA-binding transcriptional ArsR family regulator
MSLADTLAEDRRLILLRALVEASAMTLNETILKMVVNQFGHGVGRDVVRSDLSWLEDQRLVRLEKMPTAGGGFWVAYLTNDGDEVALGRRHPGVARRPN